MPYPSPPGRGLRFAAADFLLSAAAYLAASYLLVEVDPAVYLPYEGGLGCIAFTAGIIVIACYVQKLYLPEYLRARTSVALALSTVIGTARRMLALRSEAAPVWSVTDSPGTRRAPSAGSRPRCAPAGRAGLRAR
jgi:hypothetical protein